MPLDHYVTLGHSGLRVSPMCLGAMTFGEEWGFGSSVSESESIIARYLELGGNFIDTANGYTGGHSERIIGNFIAHDRSRRDRVVIATKFFGNLYPGDPNGGGASRKSLTTACEESLRRLRTDYIDLYWMHMWDKHTPIDETMRALDDLVRAGKVRYIGFSDTPAWKVAQAQTAAHFRGWTPLVALQIEYSLIQRTVEGELMPAARELGLGVTPWSPLGGGILTGKYTRAHLDGGTSDRGAFILSRLNEAVFGLLDELTRVAAELEASPSTVALAWLQARAGVTSIIIGARRLTQLEQNLAALELRLTPDQNAALDRQSEPSLNFPAAFLRNAAVNVMHNGATVNGEPSQLNPRFTKSPNVPDV
jgi:aryl-alcohol dehydrogenase-like predicted oxidoreductase